MRGRIFVGLFLCALFFVVGGDAQGPEEKPVWTFEFIKVAPENFGPAMAYLDDHWMRVRADAKRRGTVLDYHRFSSAGIVTLDHNVIITGKPKEAGDPSSFVLVTEYKNMGAFRVDHERPSLQVGRLSAESLFEAMNTQVFVEEPDTSTEFKLLTKQ